MQVRDFSAIYSHFSVTPDITGMKVEEARRRWDRGEEGAEIAFKDAQRSLRDMYARLREKEESFRRLRKLENFEKKLEHD